MEEEDNDDNQEEEEEEEEVEEENSDISGYHSDSDSTVMMSGNSPFISKTARYNFLSRSGTCIDPKQFIPNTIQPLCDSSKNSTG